MIVGMSANELMDLKEQDEAKVQAIWEQVNCKKLSFRCKAKMDKFGDTERYVLFNSKQTFPHAVWPRSNILN
jgi:hypothetical protein